MAASMSRHDVLTKMLSSQQRGWAYQEEMGTWQTKPSWLPEWYKRQYQLTGDGSQTFRTAVDPTDTLQKQILSTTTGAWNPIYGAMVHNLVSTHPGAFAALPQSPWRRTGFRVLRDYVQSGSPITLADVGVAENANLGATKEPRYFEIEPSPKTSEWVIDVSHVYQAFNENDVVTVQQILNDTEMGFVKAIDSDVTEDIDNLASNDMESIDRWTASSANQATVGWTAADEDLHGVDRSANTFFDSNQLAAASNRNLTISLWNQMYQNARPFWQSYDNKCYITGDDTHRRLSELEENKQRFTTATFTFDAVLGIGSARGDAGGFKLGQWEGYPIVLDDEVQADGISRAYLIDKDAGYIGVAVPSQVSTSDDPIVAGGYRKRTAYWMIAEAICNAPNRMAQLRDLQ